MKKKSRVLKDHKQKKKVLVPPLLDVMGDKRKSYSWVKELIPEFIWIAFLQKKLGLKQGVDIATYVGQKAEEVCKKPSPPIFAKASAFSELSNEEKKALVAALGV